MYQIKLEGYMKKVVSLLLVVAICLTFMPAFAKEAKLSVGDELSGFLLKEIKDGGVIDGEVYYFEHIKTKAPLIHIKNNDFNRGFGIGFNTTPYDSKGEPHILEHSVLMGSEKYPDPNIFYSLIQKVPYSGINAMTYPNYTMYPVAAYSDRHLLALMDVYLAGLFEPLILSEEKIFMQEGYRTELTAADGDVNGVGIVYNEMLGKTKTPLSISAEVIDNALYPDSNDKNVSGGKPEDIKTLTHQELIDFHDANYYPSNSVSYLYGDIDIEQFLKLLDSYFSRYEYKEANAKFEKQKRFTEQKKVDYAYPLLESGNISIVAKSYLVDTAEDTVGMMYLAELLDSEAGPLKQALYESKLVQNVSISFNYYKKEPNLTITAIGADKSSADKIDAIIGEVLAEMAKNLDKEAIRGVVERILLLEYEGGLSDNLAFNIGELLMLNQFVLGGIEKSFSGVKDAEEIYNKIDKGYFEGLIEKYLISNKHTVLASVYPGEKAVAPDKEEYTKEEREQILKSTAEFYQWQAQTYEDYTKSMNSAPLTFDDIKFNETELKAEKVGGINTYITQMPTNETVRTAFYLDASSVPADKLHYYKLYSSLIGSVAAGDLSAIETQAAIYRYLGTLDAGATTTSTSYKSDDYTPTLAVSYGTLSKNLNKSAALVSDLIFKPNFEKSYDEIKRVISAQITGTEQNIGYYGSSIAATNALAAIDKQYAYENYVGSYHYYWFLKELLQDFDQNKEAIAKSLSEITKYISYKENAEALYFGDKKLARAAIEPITKQLKSGTIKKASYSTIPTPAQSSIILANSSVQHNVAATPLNGSYSGKLLVLTQILSGAYLTPELRVNKGAYGANMYTMYGKNMITMTVMDPNFIETYQTFAAIPEVMQMIYDADMDLTGYIQNSLTAYFDNAGLITKVANAYARTKRGTSAATLRKWAKETASFTKEDIKNMIPAMTKLMQNSAASSVVTNENAEKYGSQFEEVVKLF